MDQKRKEEEPTGEPPLVDAKGNPEKNPWEKEKKAEENKPDPMEDFQKQLAAEKKAREETEVRLKELSAKLTQTQQENGEWLRFFKKKELKPAAKQEKEFEDKWLENPKETLQEEVKNKVDPVQVEIMKLKVQQDFQQILVEKPELLKYRERVIALSQEPENMEDSWKGRAGLLKLFKLAKAEDLEKELEKVKIDGSTEREKERAFAEEGSSRFSGSKGNKKLSPQQLKVAQGLGVAPEEYSKMMDEGY